MADCGGDVAEGCRPEVAEIFPEIWGVAEGMGNQVVEWVQPTMDTEKKRQDVIEYLQKVFINSIGIEFYPYGSVPLKTYIPDGDIDLTAITRLPSPETLPHEVFAVIQGLENNRNAEYLIKDTKFIDAQVKLVKCVVDNIAIDLSFNQLGGICTLCFLEEVDCCIGKNHLFKRSILLVKAWCLYESCILGSHQGLMSTYAMETLVLYIFQLFNASLEGPVAVLYKFLDYFSKFDWDNYCISLNGPVSKSSLPDVVVDMAHSLQNGYLLSEERLRNCINKYSVPFTDADSRVFSPKHLNIIDPLKVNNNLGRSVSLGNFYRIQSAFRQGAQNLGRVFTLPRERIADAIKEFFVNTCQRHGHKWINFTQPRPFAEDNAQLNSYNLYTEMYPSDIIYTPVDSRTGHPMGEMGYSLPLSAGGDMYPRPANHQFNYSTPAWYPRENYDCSSYYGSGFTTLDGSSFGNLALYFEETDNSSNLSDLTGNHESNIRNLRYGQHCHGHPLCSNPNIFPKGFTSRERASSRRGTSRGPGNYQCHRSALIIPEKKASEERDICYEQLPQAPSPVLSLENHKRVEKKTYSHKDEDFPPLTGNLPRNLRKFR